MRRLYALVTFVHWHCGACRYGCVTLETILPEGLLTLISRTATLVVHRELHATRRFAYISPVLLRLGRAAFVTVAVDAAIAAA
mmetsp:Transcript_103234/g.291518  ORF Transcript_103234/g.291518 Transcript_103234/m.291518 type:complete len:83 (+) Transcript_103234:16-264(+)